MTGKRKIRKWLVTTRVTSERTYEVEGLDEKEAEVNSVVASPTMDEDINEETVSVVEMGMTALPLALSTEQVRALIGRVMPAGPFKPGRYWVREMIRHAASGRPSWIYAADAEPVEVPEQMVGDVIRWARAQKRARIPASHMPRFASRFTLVVGDDLSVRVEEINIDRLAV